MGGYQDEGALLQTTPNFDQSYRLLVLFRLAPYLSADGTHSSRASIELNIETTRGSHLRSFPASADRELATTQPGLP